MSGSSDDLAALLACLYLPEATGFRWAEDHSVIERVSDGRTVAFRDEVERVLLDLADDGFTASMGSIAEAFLVARELPGEIAAKVNPGAEKEPFFIGHVAVHLLELAQPSLDLRYHEAVRRELGRGWPLGAELSDPVPDIEAPKSVDARGALAFVDAAALRRRVLTRSDRALAPPRRLGEEDLAARRGGERPGHRSKEVRESGTPPRSEGEAIRRMARSLVAAVRLPRPGAARQDVAVGGYGDLANRGRLDRLLLSELGHDDEVLAARIVLGEALYLDREAMALPPQTTRHVLVDASVRAWGMTRLVQAAATIAVLEGSPNREVATLWRALDDHLEEVEDVSEAGLEAALAALGRAPHLAQVLPEFERLTRADEGHRVVERVLVIPRRALRDPELIRALGTLGDCFVVAVDGSGEVELREQSVRGQRTIRRASVRALEHEDLGSAGLAHGSRRTGPVPDEIPAYLGVWPAPLLLTHTPEKCRWFPGGDDGQLAFVLTRDKRVLVWSRKSLSPLGVRGGGREIAVLPAGHLLYWAADGEGAAVAIWTKGRRSALAIARVTVEGPPEVALVPLDERPHGLAAVDGTFAIGLADRLVLARPDLGVLREEPFATPMAWSRDRARKKGTSAWRQLLIHGTATEWRNAPGGPIHERYERGASLQDPVNGSSSGEWIVQGSLVGAARRVKLVRVESGLIVVLVGKRTHALSVSAAGASPRWSHRGWEESRTLGGMGAADDSPLTLGLRPCDDPRFPASRFLSGGRWSDGSRIWSDRRGLLHFASSDPQLGSLSIALFADPPLTAWCSRGWEIGEAHELRLPAGEPHPVGNWLLRFADRVIQEVGV